MLVRANYLRVMPQNCRMPHPLLRPLERSALPLPPLRCAVEPGTVPTLLTCVSPMSVFKRLLMNVRGGARCSAQNDDFGILALIEP